MHPAAQMGIANHFHDYLLLRCLEPIRSMTRPHNLDTNLLGHHHCESHSITWHNWITSWTRAWVSEAAWGSQAFHSSCGVLGSERMALLVHLHCTRRQKRRKFISSQPERYGSGSSSAKVPTTICHELQARAPGCCLAFW